MKNIEELTSGVKLYFTDLDTRVTYMISESSLHKFRRLLEFGTCSSYADGRSLALSDSELVDYYIDLLTTSRSPLRPADHHD